MACRRGLAEEQEPHHQREEHHHDDHRDERMAARPFLAGDEDTLLRSRCLQIALVMQLLPIVGIGRVRAARMRGAVLREVLRVCRGDAHVLSSRSRRRTSLRCRGNRLVPAAGAAKALVNDGRLRYVGNGAAVRRALSLPVYGVFLRMRFLRNVRVVHGALSMIDGLEHMINGEGECV